MDFQSSVSNSNPSFPPTEPHKSVSHWLTVSFAIISVVGYFMISYSLALWPFGELFPPLPSVSPIVKLDDVGEIGQDCEFAPCPSSGDIIFGQEGEVFCGPQPPAECLEGMQLGCNRADKKWGCFSDTSTWQTYRNEEYGFEFKYPKDSVVNLLGQNGLDALRGGVSIRYQGREGFEPPRLIISTSPEDRGFIRAIEATNFFRNNSVGLVYEGENPIHFKLDGKDVYANCINFPKDSEVINFCNQILSTFKFTGLESSILPKDFNWPKSSDSDVLLGYIALSYSPINDLSNSKRLSLEGSQWTITCSIDGSDCNKYSPRSLSTDYEYIESLGLRGWDQEIFYGDFVLHPVIADGPDGTTQGFVRVIGNKLTAYVYSVNGILINGNKHIRYEIFLSREYNLDELLSK